jgi:hypothetical protein
MISLVVGSLATGARWEIWRDEKRKAEETKDLRLKKRLRRNVKEHCESKVDECSLWHVTAVCQQL